MDEEKNSLVPLTVGIPVCTGHTQLRADKECTKSKSSSGQTTNENPKIGTKNWFGVNPRSGGYQLPTVKNLQTRLDDVITFDTGNQIA